jgi:hypothetical protein
MMKRKWWAAVALAVTIPVTAQAQTADRMQDYLRIINDITCTPYECEQLGGWRFRVSELCRSGIIGVAAERCSDAQAGLRIALSKANSYGYGWFSEHDEPKWFHDIRMDSGARCRPPENCH